MFSQFLRIFIAAAFIMLAGICCLAQSADNKGAIFSKPGESDDDNRPRGFKETLEKMRIEKEKKDFDEMIERGEEALKISEELEKAYAQNGRLTANEVTKLETVEKLVKKIRNELGGDDDSDSGNVENLQGRSENGPLSRPDAIKSFRATTGKLFDELKKTTRFTISAAAIQTSNMVIKLARFLRISH